MVLSDLKNGTRNAMAEESMVTAQDASDVYLAETDVCGFQASDCNNGACFPTV